ncbi:WYL domain-containing protein [Pseudomonas syringae]|uniref:WYL domain-containing protein n=1 Tax=Pseudomonas syringae TaxID=317 RepID=UPI0004664CEB|nr:WYL domain-containing protein [Pseudomonas syringae]
MISISDDNDPKISLQLRFYTVGLREELPQLSQKQRDRLAFIELQAWFCGAVSRQDIVQRFELQTAAATRDLALYRRLAPDNLVFDSRTKAYAPAENFTPIFEFTSEHVLTWVSRGFGDAEPSSWTPGIPCLAQPQLAKPRLDILASICRGIKQGHAVRIDYESLRERSERELVPYALFDNGQRWHVRGYDRKSGQFRDFAITRITGVSSAQGPILPNELMAEDDQWNHRVELELVPHPKLARPETALLDFDMDESATLRIRLRSAVVGYALRQWSVDCSPDHSLDPLEFRLWLKNPGALYGVHNLELAPGYPRTDHR